MIIIIMLDIDPCLSINHNQKLHNVHQRVSIPRNTAEHVPFRQVIGTDLELPVHTLYFRSIPTKIDIFLYLEHIIISVIWVPDYCMYEVCI